MNRNRMTRYEYRLPLQLLDALEALRERRGEPINSLITKALIKTYPELRSVPADVLESFLGSTPAP